MKALQALLDSLNEEKDAVQNQIDDIGGEVLIDSWENSSWEDYLYGKKAGLVKAINIVEYHIAHKRARAS